MGTLKIYPYKQQIDGTDCVYVFGNICTFVCLFVCMSLCVYVCVCLSLCVCVARINNKKEDHEFEREQRLVHEKFGGKKGKGK